MELHLDALLVKPFRFKIDNEGKKIIFNHLSIAIKELSSKLGCCEETLRKLKKERYMIRSDYLRKLIELSGISPYVLEKHIITVKRGDSNTEIEIKLPIMESPKLALLIAKGMGDGGISADWRFFYTNQQRELIDEVINNVQGVTGNTKYTLHFRKRNDCYELKFPPLIGIVLNYFGAPRGKKIYQDFTIPDWITTSNKEIKQEFLRALFDDESCVRNYRKTRAIILAFGKLKRYKESLENFMNEIKKILQEFEICTGKLCLQQEYKNRIMLRFGINKKENLFKFKKYIGFMHLKKVKILDEALKSYKDIQRNKRLILEIVEKSSKPLTTPQIANLANINKDLTYSHLVDLVRQNKIIKGKRCNPMMWGKENTVIRSKRESILREISSTPLSAKIIADKCMVDYKTASDLLHKLHKENLIKVNKNQRIYLWQNP